MITRPRIGDGVALAAVCRPLALAASLLLAACGDSGGTAGGPPAGTTPAVPAASPPSAATVATPTAPPPAAVDPAATGPRITFASLVHDFGTITDTTTHRAQFSFTNTGRGMLQIHDVKAACGCTVPTLAKRHYQPGEQGTIDIVFDPKGKQGQTPKKITVISNAAGQETQELSLVSFIKPLVKFDRMFQLGTLPLHQETKRTITLLYTDPDLEFTELSVNQPTIDAEIIEMGTIHQASAGETTYRAVVELTVGSDTPWGLLFATRLTMRVYGKPWPDAAPVPYTYDMFLMGNVYGQIHASRAIISLGQLGVNQSFEHRVTLTSPSGTPFNVLGARITESTLPGMTVRAEPRDLTSYDVIVAGNTAYLGSIKGALEVQTDLPGEDRLLLRYSGLVK